VLKIKTWRGILPTVRFWNVNFLLGKDRAEELTGLLWAAGHE
jgi:hypothetical protein